VQHGFGHGHVYLWATDGTLMATASQSALVRIWTGDRAGYRPATPDPSSTTTSPAPHAPAASTNKDA
jgi:hypothetical protein